MNTVVNTVKIIIDINWIPPIWDEYQVSIIRDLYLEQFLWEMCSTVAEQIKLSETMPTFGSIQLMYEKWERESDVNNAIEAIWNMMNEKVEDALGGEADLSRVQDYSKMSEMMYSHKMFIDNSPEFYPTIESLLTYCYNTVLTPMLALFYAHNQVPFIVDVQVYNNDAHLVFDINPDEGRYYGGRL